MSLLVKQKEIFVPETEHGAFYKGGNVEWSPDGVHLLCQCINSIKVVTPSTGAVAYSIPNQVSEDDSDDILTFTVGDGDSLITAHRSGLLKLWNWKNGELQKSWKSIHKGPISCMQVSSDDTGCILATGGADLCVRLWILQHNACTHNLKATQGVVSVIKFHKNNDTNKLELFAAGDEFISVFDVSSGDFLYKLQAHFNRITDIDFDLVNNRLVSCGRDKVLITYDLSTKKVLKTIPIYESLETCCTIYFDTTSYVSTTNTYVLTGGEKSILHVYEIINVKPIYKINNTTSTNIYKIKQNGVHKNIFAIINLDHTINLYKLNQLKYENEENQKLMRLKKHFVGYMDQILDISILGDEETHLAVASNSNHIHLYTRKDMSCSLIGGHTDFVISLATSLSNRNLLLSGSKDNSIRVWLFDGKKHLQCIAVGSTHTKSVMCVALSQLTSSFVVSASQDTTIKFWKLPKKLLVPTDQEKPLNLEIQYTDIAHEKDINCVNVSPNDKLIATGSQDKTIKLWSSQDLKLIQILKGHKKGVWCVNFSPLDRILISSSGDTTIKLWCLNDFICLKTFESHDTSVLQCHFINRGTQILSSGTDGLIKLWSIKSATCISTFDKHEDKIWTIAITKDEERIITGGADAMIVTWKDATEETVSERIANQQKIILHTQQLENLINSNELVKALKLALKLNRPHTTLKIIQNIIQESESELKSCVEQLHEDQKDDLLKCALVWNTNAKYCYPAQLVLSVLLEFQCSKVNKTFQSSLEALIPYTQRHFHRLSQLDQDVHLLKYTTSLMTLK